jgi:hypothetical protein
MERSRGLTSGLITSIASLILVVGAALLSISEGKVPILPTPPMYPTLPVYDYSFPTEDINQTAVPESNLLTPMPSQSAPCLPPAGWQAFRVLPGDNLQTLARAYPASVAEIAAANCLIGDSLPPASIIYLPPVSITVTSTATQSRPLCGPPQVWVPYRVQPLDNLFRLSLAFGISIPELQFANCLGSSTNIYAGDFLMVPNVPTRTPIVTFTSTFTVTPIFTSTLWLPTQTSTLTLTPSPTFTPTLSETPSPTSTITAQPTQTLTSTPTMNATETPIASPTETITITP